VIGRNHRPGFSGDPRGYRAQVDIKRDRVAPARHSVKKRPFRNFDAEHLLQADALSTKLHLISSMSLRATAFVLDWEGLGRFATELDDIRFAHYAERQRA
jgi:hypothetical protein